MSDFQYRRIQHDRDRDVTPLQFELRNPENEHYMKLASSSTGPIVLTQLLTQFNSVCYMADS